MTSLKECLIPLFFRLKSNMHWIIFFFSLLSLGFVFLHLNGIISLWNIDVSNYFYLIIQLLLLISTIFIIVFLPFYPLFFIFLNLRSFNPLEKLSFTIISNLVFYILGGYIGFWSGIPITGLFFFTVLCISYFIIILPIIIIDFRTGKYKSFKLKSQDISKINRFKEFSLKTFLKKSISFNGALLIVFLFLLCILNIVRVVYFFGTDPWLHVFIIKLITIKNYLPTEEYHQTLGLHIFAAVIQFFSGVDYLLIPKYFVFYSFFVSALIFYNILMRVFRIQNLALFGVFILEFSSLNFSYMMYQFWPSGLSLILCLFMFFLLYSRLQNFIQVERPNKKDILSHISFNYIFLGLVFISSIFTHVLTTILFLLSFIWIYFIYFLKDYRRGFDFFFLCSLLGIFLLFSYFGFGLGHYWFISPIDLPLYIMASATIIGATSFGILVWRLRNTVLFTKGRFKLTIEGREYQYYKDMEDKIILPLAFGVVTLFTILFFIGNMIWFNLNISNVFIGFEILILSAFAMWGLILFQKKPRGKLFLLWGLYFILVFAGAFAVDTITNNLKIWARIFYLMPPLIVIGFVAYLYKLIKVKTIENNKSKIMILFIVGFSLFASFYHETVNIGEFNLKHTDTTSIKWFSKYTSGDKVIITKFGWDYAFIYYDYPYGKQGENLERKDVHEFVDYKENLFDPDNHIDENGTNKLQEIKKEEGTDVYIMYDDFYFLNEGWNTYGQLSEEDKEKYNDADYLNKVHSVRNDKGDEIPLYWVI